MEMETRGGRGAATATTEVLDGLNDLLQLNHDALGAYEVAIEKLEDPDHASQISGFKLDHERHVRELNEAIQRLGGSPTNEPHATGPFKKAMQGLGAMAGDRGALLAWRTNELQVRTKYDNYAAKAVHWPDEVKRLIDEQALDEERHYRWVADVLQRMGIGSGEGLETDLANRVREQVGSASARARQIGDRAQELTGRAQEMTGRARETVGAAAERVREVDPQELRADAEDQVRANPLQTLLLLFGIGFVIGRILR